MTDNARVAQILSHLVLGDGVGKVAIDIAEGLKPKGVTTVFIILTGKHDALKSVLQSKGYRVYLFNAHSSFNIKHAPANIKAIFSLARHLKINDYQIVHCHEFFSGTLGRCAALLAGSRSIVLTQHNIDAWKNPVHILIDRMLGAITRKQAANSNAVREFYLKKESIRPGAMETIYNGIELAPYLAIKPQKASPETIRIGSVGRLGRQKGYSVLARAAPLVLEKYPKAVFEVWGPDAHPTETEKAVIKNIIVKNTLFDRFILAGPTDKVPDVLSTFDIFVLPSRWEGFGLVMVEAMAAGLPVVATNVSAIPEVVEDGVTGLLVPPDDPQSLAGAIIKLCADPGLRQKMGLAGRERARRLFDREIMAKKYYELYMRVLAS